MIPHLLVGNRNLMVDPNPVAVQFSVVFTWTNCRTAGPMFVAVQQSMFSVNDDVDGGRVGVGSSAGEPIHHSRCRIVWLEPAT